MYKILITSIGLLLLCFSDSAAGWQLYPRMFVPMAEMPASGIYPPPYAPPVPPQALERLERELLKALERQEKDLEAFIEAQKILRKRDKTKPAAVAEKTALG